MQNHAASLFTKPTPLNINLGSDRFSMFNKQRDIANLQSILYLEDIGANQSTV